MNQKVLERRSGNLSLVSILCDVDLCSWTGAGSINFVASRQLL